MVIIDGIEFRGYPSRAAAVSASMAPHTAASASMSPPPIRSLAQPSLPPASPAYEGVQQQMQVTLAAASPSEAVNKVECPCCMEVYTEAGLMWLTCGHPVCSVCVLGMSRAWTEQTNHIDLVGPSSDGMLAPPSCPLCRTRLSSAVLWAAEGATAADAMTVSQGPPAIAAPSSPLGFSPPPSRHPTFSVVPAVQDSLGSQPGDASSPPGPPPPSPPSSPPPPSQRVCPMPSDCPHDGWQLAEPRAVLAATPVPSSASRSTTVSSVDEVDNGNDNLFAELQTTFQRATIFGCNNFRDPSATAETTSAESLVSLQFDERVCRRPRMFCTHCGARVLVRCEEPHCLRGPCCQPNPACPLCSDNEPVPTSALPPPSPPASPPPPLVVRGPSVPSVPLRLPALYLASSPGGNWHRGHTRGRDSLRTRDGRVAP